MRVFYPEKLHYMPSKKIFLARAGSIYSRVVSDENFMALVNEIYLVAVNTVKPVVYWDIFEKEVLQMGVIPAKYSEYGKFVICASTLGVEFDELIEKIVKESSTRAMLFDAWGSEALETLNDYFQERYLKEQLIKTTQRFSPGYGDVSISMNKIYIDLLGVSDNIKVKESGVMMPRKTTTFIAGVLENVFHESLHTPDSH